MPLLLQLGHPRLVNLPPRRPLPAVFTPDKHLGRGGLQVPIMAAEEAAEEMF